MFFLTAMTGIPCYRVLETLGAGRVDQEELLNKLGQIEEQANYTLAEYPKTLTKERLRMIVALVRYLKTDVSRSPESVGEPSLVGVRGERTADNA